MTDTDVLPFSAAAARQPRPAQFFFSEIRFPGGRASRCITRVWAPGESRLCRLCPAGMCGADHELGVCQVHTTRHVTAESAPMFSCAGPDDAGAGDYRARSV